MNRPPCTKMSSCVRRHGHKGACTAAPSAATLDWDDHKDAITVRREHEAKVLEYLDFPSPYWADLNDEEDA